MLSMFYPVRSSRRSGFRILYLRYFQSLGKSSEVSDYLIQNTDYNEAVRLEDADSKLFITREGDFTRADIFSVNEVEIFEGKENRITMVQTYSKKFHCTYPLHDYPFDTQV